MKYLLFLLCAFTVLKQNHAKFDSGTYSGGIGDAYMDMMTKEQPAIDMSKMEWKLQRTVVHPTKGPRIDGTCTVRFLNGDGLTSGNVVLFSTGEVGRWKLLAPEIVKKSVAPGYEEDFMNGRSKLATPAQQKQQQQQIIPASFDDAIKSHNPCIEIEVPSNKKGNDSVVVYKFPIGGGNVQRLATVVKGEGTVKYYPEGKAGSTDLLLDLGLSSGNGGRTDTKVIDVGKVLMHVKGGNSIVDPSWAKGRRWFWTSRERVRMKNPGYI